MRLILAIAAFLLALSPVAMAETTMSPAPVFTPEQKAEVESIIRQFLVEKEPETIAKAYEVLQQRQSAQQMEITKEGIKTHAQRIFNDKNTPVLGNPKGDVTIVEFYDYSCSYCKLAQAEVKKLLDIVESYDNSVLLVNSSATYKYLSNVLKYPKHKMI